MMEELSVQDVMTTGPTTLKRNEKLTLADDVMQLGRIRHLPVIDDDEGKLIGIVSQRDLLRGALAYPGA
jgi:CBS domain-containing membrane protein